MAGQILEGNLILWDMVETKRRVKCCSGTTLDLSGLKCGVKKCGLKLKKNGSGKKMWHVIDVTRHYHLISPHINDLQRMNYNKFVTLM